MKRTSITPWMVTTATLMVTVGLLLLVACSTSPAPATSTPVPAQVTLTSASEIVLPLVAGQDEGLESVTPPHTAGAPSAQPTSTETVAVTLNAVHSPLPTPPRGRVAISPLSSPTLAVDKLPTVGLEVVPGELAPGFTLDSPQSGPITLSDYQDRSSVVLVFYRGQT
jgi:hypothetical protein